MFSQKDLQQIRSKGIHIDEINRQIKHFIQGFPPSNITMPATPGKGILVISEGEEKHFLDVFLDNAPDFRINRFVPASGAATRMFKTLYGALDKLEETSLAQQEEWIESNNKMNRFFRKLEKYPFYEDLKLGESTTPVEILKQVLGEKGLNYGNKPKGLLKFHKYSKSDRRTAFEEHENSLQWRYLV